jgi:hypothetical protein
MGADLIVTGMLLPINGGGDLMPRGEIHALFTEKLAERSAESLEEVGDYLAWDIEDIESYPIRKRVQEAIDYLFLPEPEYAECWPRDVSLMWVKGMPLLVSGGMTWGDTPTEALDHISVLNVACLVPELDRNSPRADYVTLYLGK